MPKLWRLTRGAENTLIDIAHWTLMTFGPRQAKAYEEDLIETCQGIADGTRWTQSCRQIIDTTLPPELRCVRASQHLVIYVETDDAVVILDFLHRRSDLPKRLSALWDPEN